MKRTTTALAVALGLASGLGACGKKAPAPEMKPADKPAEMKPEDKPADMKPADMKPADEKPADMKPADMKPADEKPADMKPADASSPEARTKKYLACWDDFNNKRYDSFKGCFAADFTDDTVDSGMPVTTGWEQFQTQRLAMYDGAMSDRHGTPRTVITIGDHTFGVFVFAGTHNGPLQTPAGPIPATNKPFSFLFLHHVEWKGDLVAKQWVTFDMGTLLGQIGVSPAPVRAVMAAPTGEPEVIIAKGDDAEKAAVARFEAEIAAFGKHDIAGALANVGEKVIWTEAALPMDATSRAEVEAGLKGMFGAFSDLRIEPVWIGAAGSYTVALGKFKGTNDGENPAMKLPKTGKAVELNMVEIQRYGADGKVAEDLIFYNGLAMAAQLGLLGGGAPK